MTEKKSLFGTLISFVAGPTESKKRTQDDRTNVLLSLNDDEEENVSTFSLESIKRSKYIQQRRYTVTTESVQYIATQLNLIEHLTNSLKINSEDQLSLVYAIAIIGDASSGKSTVICNLLDTAGILPTAEGDCTMCPVTSSIVRPTHENMEKYKLVYGMEEFRTNNFKEAGEKMKEWFKPFEKIPDYQKSISLQIFSEEGRQLIIRDTPGYVSANKHIPIETMLKSEDEPIVLLAVKCSKKTDLATAHTLDKLKELPKESKLRRILVLTKMDKLADRLRRLQKQGKTEAYLDNIAQVESNIRKLMDSAKISGVFMVQDCFMTLPKGEYQGTEFENQEFMKSLPFVQHLGIVVGMSNLREALTGVSLERYDNSWMNKVTDHLRNLSYRCADKAQSLKECPSVSEGVISLRETLSDSAIYKKLYDDAHSFLNEIKRKLPTEDVSHTEAYSNFGEDESQKLKIEIGVVRNRLDLIHHDARRNITRLLDTFGNSVIKCLELEAIRRAFGTENITILKELFSNWFYGNRTALMDNTQYGISVLRTCMKMDRLKELDKKLGPEVEPSIREEAMTELHNRIDELIISTLMNVFYHELRTEFTRQVDQHMTKMCQDLTKKKEEKRQYLSNLKKNCDDLLVYISKMENYALSD